MGNKVLIVLSFMILLVSLGGLFLADSAKSEKANLALKKEEKLVNVIKLSRDAQAGEMLELSDVKLSSMPFDFTNLKDAITDKSLDYVVNTTLRGNFTKDYILRYEDIYKPQEKVGTLQSGKLSFQFPLYDREYRMLNNNIIGGDLVDVYFKYETKSPRKDSAIVSKKNEEASFQSKDEANNTNLALMFVNKKVIYMKNAGASVTQIGQPVKITPKGFISLELTPKEIKSVYAVESLGSFYFFPSNKPDKGNLNAKYYSTQQVLSKDFIKELRGGE